MDIIKAKEIFGISLELDYTEDEIRKIYYKLSKENHPDNPLGNIEFQKTINIAYEILKEEKAKYQKNINIDNPYKKNIIEEIEGILKFINNRLLCSVKSELDDYIKFLYSVIEVQIEENTVHLTYLKNIKQNELIKKINVELILNLIKELGISDEREIQIISTKIRGLEQNKYSSINEYLDKLLKMLDAIEGVYKKSREENFSKIKMQIIQRIKNKYKSFPNYKVLEKEFNKVLEQIDTMQLKSKNEIINNLETEIDKLFKEFIVLSINKERDYLKKFEEEDSLVNFLFKEGLFLEGLEQYSMFLIEITDFIKNINESLTKDMYRTMLKGFEIKKVEHISSLKLTFFMNFVSVSNYKIYGSSLWNYIIRKIDFNSIQGKKHTTMEEFLDDLSSKRILENIKANLLYYLGQNFFEYMKEFREKIKEGKNYSAKTQVAIKMLEELKESFNSKKLSHIKNFFELLNVLKETIEEAKEILNIIEKYSDTLATPPEQNLKRYVKTKLKEENI